MYRRDIDESSKTKYLIRKSENTYISYNTELGNRHNPLLDVFRASTTGLAPAQEESLVC